MKKLFALVAGIVLSVTASYGSEFLCLYTVEGGNTPEVVYSAGLTMTVDGDNLLVQPKEGDPIRFALNDLKGMEFSDDTTLGVDKLLNDGSQSFTIYNLDGVKAGEYTSINEAAAALSHGAYVIKGNNGKTVKILIGK